MKPVGIVDEDDSGLFVEILYGDDDSSLKRGDVLVKQNPELKRFLIDLQNGILHRGWQVGIDVYKQIDEFLEEM